MGENTEGVGSLYSVSQKFHLHNYGSWKSVTCPEEAAQSQ